MGGDGRLPPGFCCGDNAGWLEAIGGGMTGMRTFLSLCFLSALVLAFVCPAEAARLWQWHYRGDGFTASGTFTTDDIADSAGFYRITGITGSRNGLAITGLQRAGTAIPGNEPYAVDNLIRAGKPQLTGDGFGFALADGTFTNVFFGGSQGRKAYMEFLAIPDGMSGADDARHSESPVAFGAEERF
jgi:hypothetical protein